MVPYCLSIVGCLLVLSAVVVVWYTIACNPSQPAATAIVCAVITWGQTQISIRNYKLYCMHLPTVASTTASPLRQVFILIFSSRHRRRSLDLSLSWWSAILVTLFIWTVILLFIYSHFIVIKVQPPIANFSYILVTHPKNGCVFIELRPDLNPVVLFLPGDQLEGD